MKPTLSLRVMRSYRPRWWTVGVGTGGHCGPNLYGRSTYIFLPFLLIAFTREWAMQGTRSAA